MVFRNLIQPQTPFSRFASVWLVLMMGVLSNSVYAQQTITGTIPLQGISDPTATPVPVPALDVSFMLTSGGPIYHGTASLNAQSKFTLTGMGLASGTYNVGVKGPRWLEYVFHNITIGAGTTNLSLPNDHPFLLGGDAVDDNIVDIADFSLVTSAYGSDYSIPSSGYNPAADFNCDGSVDIGDFGLIADNYGQVGDSLIILTLSLSNPDGTALDGVVGGGSFVGKFTISNGAPPVGMNKLVLISSQKEVATFNQAPLDGNYFITIPFDPNSTTNTTYWQQNGPNSWSCLVPFTIVTSTTNYLTTFTLHATYGGATGSQDVNLKAINFRASDIFMTTTGTPAVQAPSVRLMWDNTFYITPDQYPMTIERTVNGTKTVVGSISNASVPYYDDVLTGTFNSGETVLYELYAFNSGKIGMDKVLLYKVATSANQAVDSRLDLRYSGTAEEPERFLDFQFGTRTYKGGLFAGHATDPSRSGRSFATFPLDGAGLLPLNKTFRTGNINAYFTGTNTTGQNNVTVGVICQQILDSSWDPNQIVWSNAPIPDSTTIPHTNTLIYTPSAPNPQWAFWPLQDDIRSYLQWQAPLSVIWKGVDEGSTTNAWAYFAKKDYDATLAPSVTYALSTPVPVKVFITPSIDPIPYTAPLSIQVIVNGIGIGDGIDVVLNSSNSGVQLYNGSPSTRSQSKTVHVDGFHNTFSFSLWVDPALVSGLGTTPLPVSISATCNNVTVSKTINLGN